MYRLFILVLTLSFLSGCQCYSNWKAESAIAETLSDFQKDYAERTGLSLVKSVYLEDKDGQVPMRFVLIPPTTSPEHEKYYGKDYFWMGSDESKDYREKPRHKVRVEKPFYLSITEVTQRQWGTLMKENPGEIEADYFISLLFGRIAKIKKEDYPKDINGEEITYEESVKFAKEDVEEQRKEKEYYLGPDKPIKAKWSEIQDGENSFIGHLNKTTGMIFQLPSESEWEYACRAGTETKYYWGDKFDPKYEWMLPQSWDQYPSWERLPKPVGRFLSNPWGLFDMSGNINEWTFDIYTHYPGGKAEEFGFKFERRAVRSGSFGSNASAARSSWRSASISKIPEGAVGRIDLAGFRLKMMVDED